MTHYTYICAITIRIRIQNSSIIQKKISPCCIFIHLHSWCRILSWQLLSASTLKLFWQFLLISIVSDEKFIFMWILFPSRKSTILLQLHSRLYLSSLVCNCLIMPCISTDFWRFTLGFMIDVCHVPPNWRYLSLTKNVKLPLIIYSTIA